MSGTHRYPVAGFLACEVRRLNLSEPRLCNTPVQVNRLSSQWLQKRRVGLKLAHGESASVQTMWLGNRKLAIPSFTAYSCPQFPHASFPLAMLVSMSRECKSLSVCDGSPLSSANSSTFGGCSGRFGSPSCGQVSIYLPLSANWGVGRTSVVKVFMASHSSRGSIFLMKSGFKSISVCSSSASLG